MKIHADMMICVGILSLAAVAHSQDCARVVCVNLCCPEGHLYTKHEATEDSDNISESVRPVAAPVCSDYAQELSWSPDWGDGGSKEVSLVGKDMFACQRGIWSVLRCFLVVKISSWSNPEN
eukprot:TRINITY_DN20824_c0_g1_i1.p1 TRINITY_DN20824_c0_g1~~TRINITY_DN20824_c0_g1_i1.p1  ORF type:complete len:121 (+),score=21.95 TRINITY_DN20824_c0_g1_i1:74-436(+)